MKYTDLRDFIAQLEARGELKRIAVEVDPNLEMTEICDRVLRAGGPALLFEKPKGHAMPVLANLFGTPRRVALGDGRGRRGAALREVGKLLAYLKEPEPPKGLKDAWENKLPVLKQVLNMAPKVRSSAPCQEVVWEGADVDLARLPIQTCWPGDAGAADHLGPHGDARAAQDAAEPRHLPAAGDRAEQGDHALARPSRRRARFPRPLRARIPAQPFPVAVALGADPATILGAVTPVPDTLSEYQFAGLLRGAQTELVQVPRLTTCRCRRAPRSCWKAVMPDAADPTGYETAAEGPFGDHTGYYNEVERFPVFTIERITHAPRPDLPLHLHRQAARRAGDARRGAERGVRAAAAEAVSRDRRLLPAARGLLLPAGRGDA